MGDSDANSILPVHSVIFLVNLHFNSSNAMVYNHSVKKDNILFLRGLCKLLRISSDKNFADPKMHLLKVKKVFLFTAVILAAVSFLTSLRILYFFPDLQVFFQVGNLSLSYIYS